MSKITKNKNKLCNMLHQEKTISATLRKTSLYNVPLKNLYWAAHKVKVETFPPANEAKTDHR